jgi:hypothetical protein
MMLDRLLCALQGHDDRRVHAPGRMYLCCARCARETPGWGDAVPGWSDGIVAPRQVYAGPLTFRELCAARKHKIEPAVLPTWATARARKAKSA